MKKKFGLILSLMGVLAVGSFMRPTSNVSALAPCTDATYNGAVTVKFGNIGQPSVVQTASISFDANCKPVLVVTPDNPTDSGSITIDTSDKDNWRTVKTSSQTWKATVKAQSADGVVNVFGNDREMKVNSSIVFKPTSSDTLYFKLTGVAFNNGTNVSFEITSTGTGLPLQ